MWGKGKIIVVPLPRRPRSSATWRLRQIQVCVCGPAMERMMSKERDGAQEAPSSRKEERGLLVETLPQLVARAGSEGNVEFVAQLRATLDVIPAYTWYAAPSGALTFVNKRTADYLGLPNDHPLRFGIDIDAPWDAHIPLVHPDEREESRRAWSSCLRTGEAAEFSQRILNAKGG